MFSRYSSGARRGKSPTTSVLGATAGRSGRKVNEEVDPAGCMARWRGALLSVGRGGGLAARWPCLSGEDRCCPFEGLFCLRVVVVRAGI